MNFRPQTTAILAMTADGKIADLTRSAARFGSDIDKAHLEAQISLVDGVIFGAGTLRAYGTSLPITDPRLIQSRQKRQQNEQPVHIVVSASGKLEPHSKFFQQPIPRWLLTTEDVGLSWQNRDLFERILVGISSHNSGFIWKETLQKLYALGIKKLAVLGGGELMASLLTVNAIDEIWLTVCPVIFGGVTAPTPVSGMGWLQSKAIQLDLLEVKQVKQEVFLHYKVTT